MLAIDAANGRSRWPSEGVVILRQFGSDRHTWRVNEKHFTWLAVGKTVTIECFVRENGSARALQYRGLGRVAAQPGLLERNFCRQGNFS